MPTNDELDLARAKAIAANWWVNVEWKSISGMAQDGFLYMARAIRTADAVMGVVSVPVEADLNMLNAGWEKMFGETAGPTSEVWSAMLAASPLAPEEPT